MNLYTLSRRATSTTHPSLLLFAFTKPRIIAKIPESTKKNPPASRSLLQLLQNRRIFQGRHILRNRLPLSQYPQQASHDFPRARLRQIIAKADLLGLGDGSD